jgi:hypothetical protein
MTPAASVKQQAHELIDRMAMSQVSAVVTLLEIMLDPAAHTLASAALEDELVGEDEIAAAAGSRAWLETHTAIPNRDVLAELGLSDEDFERMGQTPLPSER